MNSVETRNVQVARSSKERVSFVILLLNKCMGGGEVPFPGRIPEPIEQSVVRVNPVLGWDSGDSDSGLEPHDFLDRTLVGEGEKALPLVGRLDADFDNFVEEFVVEFWERALLRLFETENGSDMLQEFVRSPLGLEEEVGHVWRSYANLMEGRLGMVGKASETDALEGWEIDRGRSDGWYGGEAVEKCKFDQVWHGNRKKNGRP